jgi:putative phosphoesterase
MKRIGLLSDTHSYMDAAIVQHLSACDEIWHAGDFGEITVHETLANLKPLRGVYGNIDAPDIRHLHPELQVFMCEGVKVMMIHIGGYPGKYAPYVKGLLKLHQPKLFICGHSHICKVMYDDTLQCLHMNPGAAGRSGWHAIRTLLRFTINGDKIQDCEVIELGKR